MFMLAERGACCQSRLHSKGQHLKQRRLWRGLRLCIALCNTRWHPRSAHSPQDLHLAHSRMGRASCFQSTMAWKSQPFYQHSIVLVLFPRTLRRARARQLSISDWVECEMPIGLKYILVQGSWHTSQGSLLRECEETKPQRTRFWRGGGQCWGPLG